MKPEVLAYGLVAIVAVGEIVIAIAGKTIPDQLSFLGTTAIGAAAGISLPRKAATTRVES